MKRTVKTVAGLLLTIGLALVSSGCASVEKGNDPAVVNAERTTSLALEVFDAFLEWEFDNRIALSAVPEIKKTADSIRRGGITWIESARRTTKTYKANRTDENRANLETALEVLRAVIREAQMYLRVPLSSTTHSGEPVWV